MVHLAQINRPGPGPVRVTVDNLRAFVLSQLRDVADVEKWEHLIPFDNPSDWRDYLSRGVRAGNFTACEMTMDGKRSGILVYKIEEEAGRELVIVATYGTIPEISHLESLDKAAQVLAKHYQCSSIRFHTLRPGLVKRALTLGFRIAEVVLRKNIQSNE